MANNRSMSAQDVSALLADKIEPLAIAILGEPSHRTTHNWRWGDGQSMSVEVSGEKRGRWFSHKDGVGGDALELVRHKSCNGDRKAAYRWALQWLGVDGVTPPQTRAKPPVVVAPIPTNKQRIDRALSIWVETVPATKSAVEIYLKSRELNLPTTDALRFHPACPRGIGETLSAMVALMRDPLTGEPCGIHRTFLRADGTGKIEHGTAKMLLGLSGVIMLTNTIDVTYSLGIGEGIETCLAIMQNGFTPMWAVGSAGGITKFPVLPMVTDLTIFADNDEKGTGQNAAKECAARWVGDGRTVQVMLPKIGTDWADAASAARKMVA